MVSSTLKMPFDPAETNDSDGDGIGDNSDSDVDGDGIDNEVDNCPIANDDQLRHR